MSAKLFLEAKNLDSTCVEILHAASDSRMSSEILGQLTIQILGLIKSKEDWQTVYDMILELKGLYPVDPRFSALRVICGPIYPSSKRRKFPTYMRLEWVMLSLKFGLE